MKVKANLFLIELKLFFRSYVSMFFSLVLPSVMLVAFGNTYKKYETIENIIPAYICFLIAMVSLMNIPFEISSYREKKILKRFKTTPIKVSDIIASQIMLNIMIVLFSTAILFITAYVMFGYTLQCNYLYFAAAFLLSIFSMMSLGFLISCLSKSIKVATTIANIVYFPMVLLSGAVFSLKIMPGEIAYISKFLPLTYCINFLKGISSGGGIAQFKFEIILLTAIFLVCSGAAKYTFRWE